MRSTIILFSVRSKECILFTPSSPCSEPSHAIDSFFGIGEQFFCGLLRNGSPFSDQALQFGILVGLFNLKSLLGGVKSLPQLRETNNQGRTMLLEAFGAVTGRFRSYRGKRSRVGWSCDI